MIATLGASLELESLAQVGAPAEGVDSARRALAPLAARIRATLASEASTDDLDARHELALRTAMALELEPRARARLTAFLSDLQQVGASLQVLREARTPGESARPKVR